MYAPLADASLDRRLQNAYKSTRRGGAAHPWRSENFRGSRVWAMCERTRNTRRCQESWLTDNTQTLAFSGCFVVRKYTTSLTTLRIVLLRGHRWFRSRCTPSVHRRDQLAAWHEGMCTPYHPIFKRASWLPGSSVSLWSTHPQVLLSAWKSQGFKEAIVTTIGWYDLLTSTTLASTKSHQGMKEGREP